MRFSSLSGPATLAHFVARWPFLVGPATEHTHTQSVDCRRNTFSLLPFDFFTHRRLRPIAHLHFFALSHLSRSFVTLQPFRAAPFSVSTHAMHLFGPSFSKWIGILQLWSASLALKCQRPALHFFTFTSSALCVYICMCMLMAFFPIECHFLCLPASILFANSSSVFLFHTHFFSFSTSFVKWTISTSESIKANRTD